MPGAEAALRSRIELLERSVGYLLGVLDGVGAGQLRRPTPCTGWDVEALLWHLADSLEVLFEGAETGAVAAGWPAPGPVPVGELRRRATALLGSWVARPGPAGGVVLGDRALPAAAMAGIGALELSVHGWDAAVGCGLDRPLPPALAAALLPLAWAAVRPQTRSPLFAAAVAERPGMTPAERLLAHLGRDPGWVPPPDS